MTRQERININKRLNLDASKFEAMTDVEFERWLEFEKEKALRLARDYRERIRRNYMAGFH